MTQSSYARAIHWLALIALVTLLSIGNARAGSAKVTGWKNPPPTTDLTIQVNVLSGNPSATFLFNSPVGGFALGAGQSHTFPVQHSQLEAVTMASAGWSVTVSCTNGVFQGQLGVLDLTPVNVMMAPGVPATCTFDSTELASGAVYPLTGAPDTNLCPPQTYSVLAYASYYDLPVMPGLTGTPGPTVLDGTVADDGTSICVQHAPKSTWTKATVADFSQYDLLWIGSDGCRGDNSYDFGAAIKSRPMWEEAVDPNAIMVFGGDIDVHISQIQAAALDIGADIVQFLSQQQSPGLFLQVGCYGMRGAYWIEQLGGIFDGLSIDREPLSVLADPNEPNEGHPFIFTFSHYQPANWAFTYACHAGLLVAKGSAAADIGLLRVADYHVKSNYDACVIATPGNF